MASNKKTSITILVITAFFTMALSQMNMAAQKYYKWVDSKGVTHYTTTPPAGKKAALVKTYNSRTKAPKPSTKPESTAANKAKEEGEAEAANQKPQYAKNPEYCKAARNNLTTIDSNNRIRLKDNDGNLRYATHEEREKRRQEALKAIKINCP